MSFPYTSEVALEYFFGLIKLFIRLEDRKFGFLLRNKTISLNICIDVREVFSIKVKAKTCLAILTWAILR